jgi:hypothetical protein
VGWVVIVTPVALVFGLALLAARRQRRRHEGPHPIDDPVQMRMDATTIGRDFAAGTASQRWTEYGRRH